MSPKKMKKAKNVNSLSSVKIKIEGPTIYREGPFLLHV